MAIGTVASAKMAAVLGKMDYATLSNVVKQITGFQFYLTTMLVGYVVLNFIMMLIKVKKPN